jgi:hypothetical protein
MPEPHYGHELRPSGNQTPPVPLSDAKFLEQLGIETVSFETPTDLPPPVPKEWFEFNLARQYKELDPSGNAAEIIVRLEGSYRKASAEVAKAEERGIDGDLLADYNSLKDHNLRKRDVFLRIYNGILANSNEVENTDEPKENVIDYACQSELTKLIPEGNGLYDKDKNMDIFELIQEIGLAYKLDLNNSRLDKNPL